MQFAPFSFLSPQGVTTFNPNQISDLTFWVDFSDSNFYQLVDTDKVLQITSSVNDTPSHILDPWGFTPGTINKYQLTSSLSQPSLTAAKVTNRPTSYGAQSWNTVDNNAIVQGPKTDTTSYPDGMTFMVLNREYNDNLGYLIARWNGSSDRGVFFAENRTGGSYPPKTPQLTIGTYDVNSGIQYFTGSNDTANCILTRENNSATRTIWLGSTQKATNASGNDTQTRNMRQFNSLGKYWSGVQSANPTEHPPLYTYYCEVIQYNRVLTSDERTQVWNYLSNKWNISL